MSRNKLDLSVEELQQIFDGENKTYHDYKNKRYLIGLGSKAMRHPWAGEKAVPMIAIIDYGLGNIRHFECLQAPGIPVAVQRRS